MKHKILSPRKEGRRKAKFVNHLQTIKATLIQGMTMEDLEKFIPEFVMMTWMDNKEDLDSKILSRMSRRDIVMHMFEGRTLPTALETVRLTFMIEGLSATGVTHLIRHRNFSFSAQTTDSRDARDDVFLENDAISYNKELRERFRDLCQKSLDFYCDCVDSGLTLYDSRQLIPRALEAKYNMSGNITDYIRFINVRLGRQNQPIEDNVLAFRIREHILKLYPFLESRMPIEPTEWHYINAVSHNVNLNTFPPSRVNKKHIKEDYDYYHTTERDKYPHLENFKSIVK